MPCSLESMENWGGTTFFLALEPMNEDFVYVTMKNLYLMGWEESNRRQEVGWKLLQKCRPEHRMMRRVWGGQHRGERMWTQLGEKTEIPRLEPVGLEQVSGYTALYLYRCVSVGACLGG